MGLKMGAVVSTETRPQSSPRLHLAHLDGVRGCAALYVVLNHIGTLLGLESHFNLGAWSRVFSWLGYGTFAVAVFIVLSGFCLMLPIAQGKPFVLPTFLQRRARRILPPYYAALVLSLLALAVLPTQIDKVSLPSVIAHLLLIHDFNSAWIRDINGPMWSVAVEVQIYVVFALLLLPVWKRCGMMFTLLLAFGVGLIPHFSFHAGDLAHPWYLGLFAFGMAGAVSCYHLPDRLKSPGIWGALSLTLGIAVVVLLRKGPGLAWSYLYLTDALVGAAATALLVYMTFAPTSLCTTVFAGRFPTWLGKFSYSLYLIHVPLLMLCLAVTRSLTPRLRLLTLLVGGIPLCVGVAYLFYLCCERHWQNTKRDSIP